MAHTDRIRIILELSQLPRLNTEKKVCIQRGKVSFQQHRNFIDQRCMKQWGFYKLKLKRKLNVEKSLKVNFF